MPKGEKLMPKQLISQPLVNFKILELEFLVFDQNPLIAKTVPLWGRNMIMGNRGCWGPSASEGPQKHDLTMFSK
jgi:hypothetical protein